MKELQQDDTIKIVPADKGNALVVIDSAEYNNKCEEHLANEDTYKKLQKSNGITERKS